MGTNPSEAGLRDITGRQWLILLSVQLSSLLFGMTITLANVVLPQIRGALSATHDEIAWVVTLNLVATAVATPTTGWLASRLGWRGVMFGGVAGFTLFSLLCGLANSLETLVLYRVGQGLCGALIMPMGQAIVLATFPRALHAAVMVIWGFGSVVGPVAGPVIGAMIAETYSWRAVFFMIVPPGLIAMAFVWFALAGNTARTRARLDWTGFLALSIAMTGVQLMIDRGQRLDWFESPEIALYAAIGGAAFWVFAVHSLTSPAPFLDPRLLLDRNFAIGLVIAFFMGMLAYTTLVLFPTLLHDLRGYPDGTIGELLAARGVGNWFAFLVVVPISRRLPRLTVALGLGAQSYAAWQMAQLNLNLSSFDVFWTNALQGFGFGLAFTPMTVLAFATLPAVKITEASGVFTLVRNFGSSLYISLSVALLVRSTAANYARLVELVNPFNPTLKGPDAPAAWSIGTTGGLIRLAGEIQRQASMIGYINAFYLIALTAAVAVPLVSLMRSRPIDP
ncbi:MAG TPA: DHA2 family efflux MFS transporter permease subunit [Stellaceae bacterium]|jgi:DHA2 family multidrug resistance protein|nr:DHA2 family efflux MFS transporter permease subunit [Stellaceae bacterium]